MKHGATPRVISRMPEGGVIFSDAIFDGSLAFNSGGIAEIAVAARKANLVVG